MASFSERPPIDTYQLMDEYMEQEKMSWAATAAFTGHRFIDASLREHVKRRLSNAVLDAYGNGVRNLGYGRDGCGLDATVLIGCIESYVSVSGTDAFRWSDNHVASGGEGNVISIETCRD